MTYKQAQQYLNSLNSLGSIPGLASIRELLFRIHNPEKKCKVIHIAGTNGKGSVGAIMAALLRETGFSVGRYTSPAVFNDLEIITLNGRNISRKDFAACLNNVRTANESMIRDGLPSATRFEIETAVAFEYFALKGPDYVLIECGMGGLLDATNVMEGPELSVITNISYDHMNFLGNTLYEIGSQKAGILKENCKAIAIPSDAESDRAISEYSERIGARLSWCPLEEYTYRTNAQKHRMDFGIRKENSIQWFSTGLSGRYQYKNIALAYEGILKLLGSYPADKLEQALKKLKWPGRFEYLHQLPDIIIDGAHNPDGAMELAQSIQMYYPNRKVMLVMGVFKDKDYSRELETLIPLAGEMLCIATPENPRALPAKELAKTVRLHYDIPVRAIDNLEKEIPDIFKTLNKDDVVIICGSLSHLKYFKKMIRK